MSPRKPVLGTLLLLAAITPGFLHAQTAPPTSTSSTHTPAFEVVSIRPSQPGGQVMFGLGRNNVYVSRGMPIFSVLLAAYLPQPYWTPEHIQGGPSWLKKDTFDIEAKLDADTVEAWKNLNPLQKQDVLRPLLQAMLAQRFHLVAHTVPTEIPGYALVVAKGGPKLKESQPGATLPSGIPLPHGGVMVPYQRGERPHGTYYAASLADLPFFLGYPGYPIQDQTGLTGHYDFTLQGRDDWDGTVSAQSSPDPSTRYQFDDLGLAIKPIKVPTITIVIDSLDHPTEN